MITKDDCSYIEYRIGELLEELASDEIKDFWYDGVMPSKDDCYYSRENIKKINRLNF